MKILIISLFVTCFSLNVKAQTASANRDTSCNFLKKLQFKHGVDTVVIKATYVDLIQLAPFTTYEESFLKRRKINIRKIGSEIEFRPPNCTNVFSAQLMTYADKEDFLTSDNLGISVYLTCVVFEGYLGYTDHSPYVIVIKVVPKMPIRSM